MTAVQAAIYQTSEQIDLKRSELKFSKEELEEWSKVQTEKEEDTMALLKYSKEDEIKIKQMSSSIEKMIIQVQKKKNALNAEVNMKILQLLILVGHFLIGDRDSNISSRTRQNHPRIQKPSSATSRSDQSMGKFYKHDEKTRSRNPGFAASLRASERKYSSTPKYH